MARQWLHPTDGFGHVRPELARICARVAREARSRQAALEVNTDVLVHYVPLLTRLVIFGAGDDARPLCDVGASLGWHVSVADRRARLATQARFPNAALVLAADFDTTPPVTDSTLVRVNDLSDAVLAAWPARPNNRRRHTPLGRGTCRIFSMQSLAQ